jgi:cytochrome b involved in lipid metabolism
LGEREIGVIGHSLKGDAMRRRFITALATAGFVAVALAPAAVAVPSYTAAQVAKHASASSCWTIVGTSVYDVTKYITRNTGGAAMIKALCGKDGTAAFSGQANPKKTLARYRIGALKVAASSSSPSPSSSSGSVITAAMVATHATPTDCWTTISGRVYNLTPFIASHPGGVARIVALCGTNGTAAFTGQHAGNLAVLASLAPLQIGTDGTVSATATAAPKAPGSGADDGDDDGDDDDDDGDDD